MRQSGVKSHLFVAKCVKSRIVFLYIYIFSLIIYISCVLPFQTVVVIYSIIIKYFPTALKYRDRPVQLDHLFIIKPSKFKL